VQRDLLASLKGKMGTEMVLPPGFTGGPGGLEASQHAPRQKKIIGEDDLEFFIDLDEEKRDWPGTGVSPNGALR
jgi:hypothetical protein